MHLNAATMAKFPHSKKSVAPVLYRVSFHVVDMMSHSGFGYY
jgi:hypothetical protein